MFTNKVITTTEAKNYMKDWLHFTSIQKVNQDDEFMYFTTRNQLDQKCNIKIEINGFDYWNIWENIDGQGWEWIDAIGIEESA